LLTDKLTGINSFIIFIAYIQRGKNDWTLAQDILTAFDNAFHLFVYVAAKPFYIFNAFLRDNGVLT
jgi:hypothetical protein